MTPFYWGNSSSSMQTEGGWNEGGKSLSVYDIVPATSTTSDWQVANDNYHNFTEDLDYMADLGMSMYRFQISWSRCVQDGDGDFNEEGFRFYDELIAACQDRHLEPMICLYHFDMPLKLATEHHGFADKYVVAAFVRFGQAVIDRYAGKVKFWLTFNEQNLYSQPNIAFQIAGATKAEPTLTTLYQITHNVMVAHAELTAYLHQTQPDAKMGGMVAYSEVYPATCSPQDVFYTQRWQEFINFNVTDVFAQGHYSPAVLAFVRQRQLDLDIRPDELEVIAHHRSDFLAFSYYASTVLSAKRITPELAPNDYLSVGGEENPHLAATEWGWQIDPLGFRQVMTTLYQRYGLPVFPIENGIGLRETWDGHHPIQDDQRIEYHRQHLQALQAARDEDGVDIMGYLGWGLIDILSSQGDMEKRYGVVYVNRGNHDLRDMKRVPKKSYYWLQKVIRSDGKDLN